MAAETVFIKWPALLCTLKVTTSFFSKNTPMFVAVIKAGEGKVSTESWDQPVSSFFALASLGNFLLCQVKTSSSDPVTLDLP